MIPSPRSACLRPNRRFATGATTLLEPVYEVLGVGQYGVANMPALVPRTSTFALTNATLPYVQALAGRGIVAAVQGDSALARGANVWRGQVVHPAVAQALGMSAAPLEAALDTGRR